MAVSCAPKPVLLFAHPSMHGLATAVVESAKAPSAAAGNRREVCYKQHGIKWNKFKDCFPNLFIEEVKQIAEQDVMFIASFHSPEVIFEQLSVIYSLPRYLVRSFTLILPYFPTGTMERVDTEGQIATAKTLAQLLSVTPLTSRGPSQIVIYDIHALQERFYFAESVIPRLESAIPLLEEEMKNLSDVSVAFPDDGAFKRFHFMFGDKDLIVCNKVRDGNARIVRVKEGVAKDRNVIIVDDLVQSGGTLIECAKALLQAGAKSVSAYVTHPVFPCNSWTQFLSANAASIGVAFETFWITDSIPHAGEIAKNPPFKLLSLGSVISNTLLG